MLKVSNFQQKNYSRQLNSNQNQSQPAFKAKLNGIDEFIAGIALEAPGAQPNLRLFAEGLREISEALKNIGCPDFHVILHPGSIELGQVGNDKASVIPLAHIIPDPQNILMVLKELMGIIDPKVARKLEHRRSLF